MDKTVDARTQDLKNWVEIFRQFVNDKRVRKLTAFANTYYGGHAPGTIKLFWIYGQSNPSTFTGSSSNSRLL
jgi:hypothetical protein